ncbi:hypothetical protein ACFIOY_36380 [Bradyrhizobium sp. TZ2]
MFRKRGTKILTGDLMCETVARRQETAHVADSQRSSDPLFKNKRSRTIAKGGGLDLAKPSTLVCRARWVLRAGESLCETPLTLTPRIVARSFERLAKNYGRH